MVPVHGSRWGAASVLLAAIAVPARYGAALSIHERSPLSQRPRKSDSCSDYCFPAVNGRSKTLPNVLIIGDSISMDEKGSFNYTKALLEGVASVQKAAEPGVAYTRMQGPCGTSFGVVDCMDVWLDGGGWDVISFNWGLHDICPDFYGTISTKQYIKNLDKMYQKIKLALAPNGSVIFQETTPVPPLSNRNITDVYEINALARAMFASYTPPVPVTPLFDMVVSECQSNLSTQLYPNASDCPQLQYSDDVHFSERGLNFTGAMVASSILQALKKA